MPDSCALEPGCDQPVAGAVDGRPACETHLAREFERRVGAGEPVGVSGERGVSELGEPAVRKDAPLSPGTLVVYRHGPFDLPAVVVCTAESRAEAVTGAGGEAMGWVPELADGQAHLVVLLPRVDEPFMFLPRVEFSPEPKEGCWTWR